MAWKLKLDKVMGKEDSFKKECGGAREIVQQ